VKNQSPEFGILEIRTIFRINPEPILKISQKEETFFLLSHSYFFIIFEFLSFQRKYSLKKIDVAF